MMTLISGAIGGLVGLLKFLLEKRMEMKHTEHLALMEKAGIVVKDRERAASIKDTGVAFTRRIIAITLTMALVAPVFYGFLHPDATISIPHIDWKSGFWDTILPWGTAKEVITYKEVKAPLIAAPIIDLCAMVVGYYFGSGGSRK